MRWAMALLTPSSSATWLTLWPWGASASISRTLRVCATAGTVTIAGAVTMPPFVVDAAPLADCDTAIGVERYASLRRIRPTVLGRGAAAARWILGGVTPLPLQRI